jgi:phage terminase large subunit GpA-like protein
MTPAAEKLRQHLRMIYSPIDRRTVVDWCEDELHLSERQTQMPGRFSTELTPYLREPLECFGDVDCTDVVLVFGTQCGKTTMIQAGVAWRVVNKPQPMVWVMPTENLAGSFSETRWMPICEDSPAVAAKMPRDRHKWKRLEQHFDRCTLVFVGSNSPANLASRPAGLLLLDETEKFAQETDRETSALFLAENRTKSFAGALRVKTSTPTTPDGPIWVEFLKGTQEKYLVPCPHCQERIELLWEQVRWEGKDDQGTWNLADVERTAHYVCQRCGGQVNDGQKIEMVQAGKWSPTNTNAMKGFRSFHLNSLYAPWRSCTFGALACKFIKDKESLNGLQDFTNSTLALPWEQVETNIGESAILALRGGYTRGSCPVQAAFVVCCADVGQDESHWATVAFGADGASFVLDYGRVLAVEDLLSQEIIGRKYRLPDGGEVAPQCGLIDSGFATFRVYRTCAESGGFYFPAKGSKATFGSKITTTTLENFPGVLLYTFADHAIKTELFLDRIKRRNPPIQIPADATNELLRGMSGQMLVPRKTGAGKEFVWKEVAQDHYMDAIKLCHIAFHVLKNI